MTLAELRTMLEGITGFKGKTAYKVFKGGSAPALPFIVYYVDGTDNFKADDSVYLKRQQIIIELYTSTKSPTTEALIEAALDAAGIPWDYTESYIESEKAYLIAYTVEV